MSGAGVDRPTTIAEAKKQTQAVERQIIALVPAEFVAEVRQQEKGVFLDCRNGDVSWTGGAFIAVTGEPDFLAILVRVQEEFATREGWSAKIETKMDGDPNLEITNGVGSYWAFTPMPDGADLFLSSLSSCVPLPEGMWSREEY